MIRRVLEVCAVAGCSVLLAAQAYAGAKMISGSPRAEKVNAATVSRRIAAQSASREKWTGTKAIIFDAETKSLRKPNAVEVAQMVQSLRQLTNRPARISPRIATNGVQQGDLSGAFATVLVGRARTDGSVETKCVLTFDEAAEFLGLQPEAVQ
jgi:hypothetical protein